MTFEHLIAKLRAKSKIITYRIKFGSLFDSPLNQREWGINTKVHIENGGHLSFGKSIWLRDNIRIDCADNAIMEIGDRVFCNNGTYISARKRVIIGAGTMMGPNVMIFDHDHDYRDNLSGFVSKDIIIGSSVWIGANAVILKGTEIGDHSVIGAGCVVSGCIPSYSVVTSSNKISVRSFTPR